MKWAYITEIHAQYQAYTVGGKKKVENKKLNPNEKEKKTIKWKENAGK